MNNPTTKNSNDLSLKKDYQKATSRYFRKGLLLAFSSGISYGMFSAFITVGEAWGKWNEFWALPLASTIVGYCLLSTLGSGLNDLISGIWCLLFAIKNGKLRDMVPSIKSKPCKLIVGGALAGSIASFCYVIGLMMAGGIAAAITALCSAIGAILARILYKQKLNLRMMAGIFICFLAAVILGGTTFSNVDAKATLGMLIAFIAAFCWGIEGCIVGYGTVIMDYQLAVTIRQVTSGLLQLIIYVPVFCIIAGRTTDMSGISGSPYLYFVGGAIGGSAILWFIISGFFANPAYSLWYKGNSMCGTALGMVCNAMYAFWCPLFMMILCGKILGWSGYDLTPIQWAMALVELLGIWLIAMNPLDLFRKKEI